MEILAQSHEARLGSERVPESLGTPAVGFGVWSGSGPGSELEGTR